VTFRILRLLALQLLLMFACAAPAAAAETSVEITHAHIDATDEGYRLSVAYAFDLNHGLEDAIQHGVPLYFTTEIDVVRPRWNRRDEEAISKRITARNFYDVLTRQYHVTYTDSVRQTFNTLDEALFTIRRPSRFLIGPKGALKPGETYTVTLKMGMDREYFSKPIQVNAFNNAEWRLNSNTKRFTYKAE
jgi:hypothetical protein